MGAKFGPEALGIATIALGSGISVTFDRESLDNLGSMLFIIGSFIIAIALLHRSINRVHRPADEAFNDGFEMGYERGWREGRQTARPVVVSIPVSDRQTIRQG